MAEWNDQRTDHEQYDALRLVEAELWRQHARWGEQNHPDGTGPTKAFTLRIDGDETYAHLRDVIRRGVDEAHATGEGNWAGILLEEVFEALAEDDPEALSRELIQVAAVAVQWALAIKRRGE